MKLLVVLALCLGVVFGDSCDNSFKGFLDCIAAKTGDSNEGKVLDTEFDNDFVKLAGQCFNQSDNSNNDRCYLSKSEMDIDVYGDEGPLRGCSDCQKIAKDLRKKFFDAPESVRSCLRKEFSNAVVDEIQPCMQDKLGDFSFRIPPLPDFDKNSYTFLALTEKAINHRIWSYNREEVCRGRSPAKADKTRDCLNKGYPGIYQKHCDLIKNCQSSNVQSNCNDRFGKVKDITCKCMEEKRQLWHQKLDDIKNSIFKTSSADACASGITKALGSWKGKIEKAINTCISEADIAKAQAGTGLGGKINLDVLIRLGCGEAQANGADKQKDLQTGFRFIRILLDAMNDRITRFCVARCSK